MRSCAKKHCGGEPAATIALRYRERQVVIGDLLVQHDPNLLDLCRAHADRLTAMVGWHIRDERSADGSFVDVRELVRGSTPGR